MRSKRLARKKWARRILFFLIVVLLFILAALCVNLYFSPIISRQLKNTVVRMSNGLYQVDFASVRLHVLSGRIVINDLQLKIDHAVFMRLKSEGKAPNNLYDLSVNQIVLKNFHPFKLYFHRALDVDEILITSPNVQSFYQDLNDADTAAAVNKKTFYQRISGVLKSVHIGRILMNDINLRYEAHVNNHIRIRHLKDIQIKATDLLINQNSENELRRFLFCTDVTAIFRNYHGSTADELYQYSAQSVIFSSAKAAIKLNDAVFMPVKTADTAAAAKIKPMRAVFRLQTDSVRIDHFDYRAFIRDRNFKAADVSAFGGKIDLFFDHTLPPPPNALQNSGLHVLLSNIRQNISIKKLHLHEIDLVYSEVSPKTKLPGTITFKQLSGTINNLVTGKDTATASRSITANLAANLMGYGKLAVNMRFNAADSNALLYYKGSLGAMNLVNLNPASKPLGLLQFTSGFISSLTFDMQANAEKATGKVLCLYEDLNVTLLRKDEKNALRRMGFMSILANAMILIRDNPTYNHPPRLVTVNYERPENSSYAGMIWRSIFAGIKESIGFTAEIEHTIRQKIADQQQGKELRQQRKAERQERRKSRRMKRHLKEARDY